MNFDDYVSEQFDTDLKDDSIQVACKMHTIKPATYKFMSNFLQNEQLTQAKLKKKHLKQIKIPRKLIIKVFNQQFASISGSKIDFNQVSMIDIMKQSSIKEVVNNDIRFCTSETKEQTPPHRRPSIERIFKQQQQYESTLKTMKLMRRQQRQNSKNSKSNKSQKNLKWQKKVKVQNSNYFQANTEKQFQDCTKFRGICQKGVLIKGQLTFTNKFIYNGELFLNKFHGKGKLILPTGQIIQADWIQGQINGKATIKYPQGQLYYGNVKHYRRHGEGNLFFSDGTKYQGAFVDGEVSGYGQFTAANGDKTIGYWLIGQYLGLKEEDYQIALDGFISRRIGKLISIKRGRNKNSSQTLGSTIRQI